MLFGGSKIVIFLKRNSLEVYSKKTDGVESRLEFPPNFEKDQEILNLEKFEQLIANFLTKLDLKEKKVIIGISAEDLFEKTLPLSDKKTEDAQTKKFFGEIPFDANKIAKLEIRTKNGINLIATNRNLFDSIVHTLQKSQAEVEAVVPVSILGVTSSTLTKEDISKILGGGEILNKANFMLQTQQEIVERPKENIEMANEKETSTETKIEESDKITGSKKSPILIIGIAIMLIGLGVIAYLLFLVPKPPVVDLVEDLGAPAQTAEENSAGEGESIDSADTESVSKEEIRVEILNGTGIGGQASQVKTLLEGLGYLQIETGNAENSDFETALVKVSSKIGQEPVDELETELEKVFESVEVETGLENDNFDVIITTGIQI